MTLDTNSILPFLLTGGEIDHFRIACLLLFPFIVKNTEWVLGRLQDFYDIYIRRQWNLITFEGSSSIQHARLIDDYSFAFSSISHYVSTYCKCEAIKEMKDYSNDRTTKYILSSCSDFLIGDDIYIDIYTKDVDSNEKVNNQQNNAKASSMTRMILKSKTKSVAELKEFVEKCNNNYSKHVDSLVENKIYHFIYKNKTNRLNFTSTVISDLTDENNMNFETFDHIFNEHKDTIIADMDRLNDIDYYRRNGIKRKKGYLFYGNTGCGKTYTVMAMANKGKRHIIEVPMSRVKTNEELEDIINLTNIDNVKFDKEDVIILFDEIDCGSSLKKRDNFEKVDGIDSVSENHTVAAKEKDGVIIEKDELSLGTVLSRLDGIGSYNGIIFIATTNCINSLDPAIYRHGRMDPYNFTYLRRIDTIELIEKSYDCKLSENQLAKIPGRNRKISPSSLKKYIQDYENDLPGLLEYLRTHGEVK